jgi:hypothetical protein
MSLNIVVLCYLKPALLGVFAGRQKIPKGSFIGIYAGELLTENEGEERGM